MLTVLLGIAGGSPVTVTTVDSGSSSDIAGLLEGDVLVLDGDVDVTHNNKQEIVRMVMGEGSGVTFTVKQVYAVLVDASVDTRPMAVQGGQGRAGGGCAAGIYAAPGAMRSRDVAQTVICGNAAYFGFGRHVRLPRMSSWISKSTWARAKAAK